DKLSGSLGIVVLRNDKREGRAHRVVADEGKNAAVIGTIEDQDVRAPRAGAGSGDCIEVRLGAGIAETNLFQGGEALAHELRQLRLPAIGSAEIKATVESRR